MDENFKKKVTAWFTVAEKDRDLKEGALLILQFTRNHIQYNNTMRCPERYRDNIIYQLEQIRKMIADNATRETVRTLTQQVKPIIERNRLSEKSISVADAVRRGMRADHDRLPSDIQKFYDENVQLYGKMRGLHASLTRIPDDDNVCHASDRYPLLKELVEADKQYHSNWKTYDNYVLEEEKQHDEHSQTSE